MPITLTTMEASNRSKRPRKPIGEIDADIAEAVDSGFEWCKTNNGRLVGKFASQEEAEDFLADARSYAYQHEPRYVVTGNTTKGGQARFRVELYTSGTEEADSAATA